MINQELLTELQIIEATDSIEAYLVNYATDETILRFLLPPNSLSFQGSCEYRENNPLFGKTPYVRFSHAKAIRLTVEFIFTTPCEKYDLAILEAQIDSLRYPIQEVITPEEEVEVTEGEAANLPANQIEQEVEIPPNPDQLPDTTPINPELPVDPNNPELPIEEVPPVEPITVNTDPPQLSLVFGSRVIAPIKLESYSITEPKDKHTNGQPTYLEVTLNFIGLNNPIF